MLRSIVVFAVLLLGTASAFAQSSPSPPPSALPAPPPRPDPSSRPGFRNPGGVGRRAQYYPAGDRFQNPGRLGRLPTFGEYPAFTSRSMQLQAQSVGISRSDMTYRHIDAYGRPMFFWWFPWAGLEW